MSYSAASSHKNDKEEVPSGSLCRRLGCRILDTERPEKMGRQDLEEKITGRLGRDEEML